MNLELNYDFVGEYKRKYTTKLVDERIGKGETITGKEILKLTASRQYNLFIIKILFQEWQEEMKQLESPYFDYKDPTVRKAMVEFMNVLSQHIEVKSEDILPLLEKAYDDIFVLHIDPAGFLQMEFQNRQVSELSDKLIKQFTKYLVVLKEEFKEFFNEVEGEPISEVIEKAKYYFEGHDAQAYLEKLISEFSDVESVTLMDFAKEVEPEQEEAEEVATELNEIVEPTSDELEEPQDEPETQVETENEPEPEEVVDESVAPEPLDEVVTNDESIDEDEITETLNDKFEVEAKTLADLHEEKKIDSIMEAISINHRYMFLQELFDGDNDQFQKAISKVEECETFDDAVEMLVQNYAKEYFWDMNSDEVKELLKVIFRRFRS